MTDEQIGIIPRLTAERDAARTEAQRLAAKLEEYRAELRDRSNEDLALRGLLSPNGREDVVPFGLGDTLVPAVEWLIAERDRAMKVVEGPLTDWAERVVENCGVETALVSYERALLTALDTYRAGEGTESTHGDNAANDHR